ncbi:MAG: AMIN domain-containing protein [Desulfobacteraceae bacterium]|nr:AMIN domain-containing protein [Desulfobacteraceae bacterium]
MLKLKTLIPGLLLVLLFFGAAIPASCASATAQQQYVHADATYLILKKNPAKQKYRESWVKCINQYQRVNTDFPDSSWAPAGLYRSAQLYLELHKRSRRDRDKIEAIDLLKRIQGRYPDSAYTERARHLLKKIASARSAPAPKRKAPLKRITSLKKRTFKHRMPTTRVAAAPSPPKPVKRPRPVKQSKPAKQPQPASPSTDTHITGLRFWSNPEYTRVVIDASRNRTFSHKLLKKDPATGKPQRLYIDLHHSRLGKGVPRHTAINDNLLIQARAGQYSPHTVRVVIDIKSFDNYKVFSLKDPFRLVVDVWAKGGARKTKKNGKTRALVSTDNLKSSDITRQLALGVRKIVIDPGHGGKDPGAPGYLKNVWEKDVVLKISKRLAAKMRDRLKCDVVLTRSTDTFLTLEERTAIANTRNADLFISLHCNAARSRNAYGMETYFLNLATDDQAIAVAARENATSRKNISDLESILNDLMKNAKINESSRLATKVQGAMCKGLAKKYSKIKSLGVKQAPFYVLLGARMPSILIETSFLSNKRECKRLVSSTFQERLCDSIIDGVERYIKETNPKTF